MWPELAQPHRNLNGFLAQVLDAPSGAQVIDAPSGAQVIDAPSGAQVIDTPSLECGSVFNVKGHTFPFKNG